MLKIADRDDEMNAADSGESAELREADKRIRLLEQEAEALIEQRAQALALNAIKNRKPLVEQLGEPSVTTTTTTTTTTIAADRDRYGITSRELLDGQTADDQRVERARADAALRRLHGVGSPASRAD